MQHIHVMIKQQDRRLEVRKYIPRQIKPKTGRDGSAVKSMFCSGGGKQRTQVWFPEPASGGS